MLVLQEVFALLATYNLIRSMMVQAASAHSLDPLNISFGGTLEVLTTMLPYLVGLGANTIIISRPRAPLWRHPCLLLYVSVHGVGRTAAIEAPVAKI